MVHIHHNAPMYRLYIIKLAVTYRKFRAHNLLCIISCRLVYLEPTVVSTNNICRIIVHLSLRRITFNSMHASPATRHMEEHKTLHRLKLRSLWPHMRTDIKDWVK